MAVVSPLLFQVGANPMAIVSIALMGIVTSWMTYSHFHHSPQQTSRLVDPKMADFEPAVVDEIPAVADDTEDTLSRFHPEIDEVSHSNDTTTIPEAFDAREKWPMCKHHIGKVWDQGSCASCWAVSAASVMTDRLCIQSNGKVNQTLSPQHLICSCTECTKNNSLTLSMPMCRGGDSESAWKFWNNSGLVSGGDYGTNQSCLPYLSEPCLHSPGMEPNQGLVQCAISKLDYSCPSTCVNSNNTLEAEKKFFGSKIYYIRNNTFDIQREIMLNGPVQAKHSFGDAFRRYSKGLYSCDSDVDYQGKIHSVKIIGWNKTKDGVPYWLCVNSFSSQWGEQGLFKIKLGINMCNIEESVMAGDAKVDSEDTSSPTISSVTPPTTPVESPVPSTRPPVPA